MTLHALVDRFFAADGPLKDRLPGYAPRAAQVEMAHAVADALSQPAGRLVVEAGTGVGKSLAYLAPAFLSKKKAVVTTATKALQDQLFTKDVPLAWACARAILDEEEGKDDAVLVKGRQNYLCKLRFEEFSRQPLFVFPGDAAPWPRLVQWAGTTVTGDRAEVPGLPEPFSSWSELDAGSDTCLGTRCAHHDACFVTQNKRRADGARLVVANHHLLCADLRVRLESRQLGDGTASVLPRADLYVLDEAHALPDVASEWFGVTLTSVQHDRLLGDVRRFAEGRGGDDRAALLDAVFASEDKLHRLWARLRINLARERAKLNPGPETVRFANDAMEALAALGGALEQLPFEVLSGAPDILMKAAERDRLLGRAAEARSAIELVLLQAPTDTRFVVVAEENKRAATVTATPVDVAQALSGTVFALSAPLVLTSATLAVGRSTRAFMDRIGLAEVTTVTERVLPSPFDFARQAALYCPKDMPAPDDARYPAAFLDEARFLLELSMGGALFLFTSHAAMESGFAALLPHARQLGITAKKQGDAQKRDLLDALRGHDGEIGMMLCATHSFWEGVDVKGRALRVVCIDKLPFKVPTDPVRQARAELCRARGGDPFNDIAVPEAALTLKQGAGRLLRGHDDAGVVAILDGRLRKKRYGPVLLDTLPPMTRIGGRAALADFYARFVGPTLGLPAHRAAPVLVSAS